MDPFFQNSLPVQSYESSLIFRKFWFMSHAWVIGIQYTHISTQNLTTNLFQAKFLRSAHAIFFQTNFSRKCVSWIKFSTSNLEFTMPNYNKKLDGRDISSGQTKGLIVSIYRKFLFISFFIGLWPNFHPNQRKFEKSTGTPLIKGVIHDLTSRF